jgi:hypothetical protein
VSKYVGSSTVLQTSEGMADMSKGVWSIHHVSMDAYPIRTFDTSQVPRAFTVFMRSYFFKVVSCVVVGEIADARHNNVRVVRTTIAREVSYRYLSLCLFHRIPGQLSRQPSGQILHF